MNRREFLAALAALPLLADSSGVALAANTSAGVSADAVRAARVLTGRSSLPEAVIARAVTLLTTAKPQFQARLAALAKAIGDATPEQRDEVIASLSDADAATAVELIAPLYLGFTGTPSTIRAMDDAQFVTFRDALMYEPTADNLVRPSYARGGADYWVEPPAGVTLPPMDPDILASRHESGESVRHLRTYQELRLA